MPLNESLTGVDHGLDAAARAKAELEGVEDRAKVVGYSIKGVVSSKLDKQIADCDGANPASTDLLE